MLDSRAIIAVICLFFRMAHSSKLVNSLVSAICFLVLYRITFVAAINANRLLAVGKSSAFGGEIGCNPKPAVEVADVKDGVRTTH